MAHKTPLATWLYSNREVLSAQFREFNWPVRYLPGVFDFSTKIFWDGIEAEGRGVDLIREIALEKSASEAIERLICKSLNFDSVGFAVAGSHNPAAHARFEALERYYLNFQIENQVGFNLIEDENSVTSQFRETNSKAELSFYQMATPLENFGIVCKIERLDEKVKSLGFAFSESLDQSLRRSLFEALPNFTWFSDGPNYDSRTQEAVPWHVDEKFLDKIEPLFQAQQKSWLQQRISPPCLEQVNVDISLLPVLKTAPIQLARFILSTKRQMT